MRKAGPGGRPILAASRLGKICQLEIPDWNLKLPGSPAAGIWASPAIDVGSGHTVGSPVMVKQVTTPIPAERIEKAIFLIRGLKVMIDADLATLYGVTTGNLNKAVSRN